MNHPSATPVAEYLESGRPGMSVDNRYLVLPRIVLEQLPRALQSELVQVVTRIHEMSRALPWPQAYRVEAAHCQSLKGLDETGLQQLGVTAELDWNGDLIHRDTATGRPLSTTELDRTIQHSCPDQLYT
jgi:hypothetical protein